MAFVAGAGPGTVVCLGFSMLFLQFAIGTANDMADVGADSLAKPHKPIPAGLLSRWQVSVLFGVCTAVGLTLAASVSVPLLVIGVVGLVDGLVYDWRLKGTVVSWVPFAAGVGLLPVFGWVGATGELPSAAPLVVSLAVAIGGALALANAYADLEDDRATQTESVATLLGSRGTLIADGAVLALVYIVAYATTVTAAAPPVAMEMEVIGALVAATGLGLAGVVKGRWRHLVWEVEGLGLFGLSVGWLAAMDSVGVLR